MNFAAHRVLAAAGLAVSLAGAAGAQQIIVKQFDNAGAAGAGSPQTTVPGLPASQTNSGATPRVWSTVGFWSQDTTSFSFINSAPLPVIDGAGNIAFWGQIATASGVIATSGTSPYPNAGAIFYATRADNYAFTNPNVILARDGTPGTASNQGGVVPAGLPANWQLDSLTPLDGLTYSVGMSSSGQLVAEGVCKDPVNNTATGTNNSFIFTGTPSTLAATAQRSIAAPNTGGNLLGGQTSSGSTSNLNAYNTANAANVLQVNPSGQTFFQTVLQTGTGPTITSSGTNPNDQALWLTTPGHANLSDNLTKVARRNDFVSGSSGEVFGAFNANNSRALNANGDVVFSNNLNTTTTSVSLPGSVAAATNNNNALFIRKASTSALTVVAREGNAVGGSSSLSTATYKSDSSGTTNAPYMAALSHQPLNNSGHLLYDAFFNVGGAITASSAEAIMLYDGASSSPLCQAGVTPVPGVAGATFQQFWSGASQAATMINQSRINNLDHVLLVGQMTAGGSVTANVNDQGMWLVNNASPALIARGGDAAPGAGGASFSSTFLYTTLSTVPATNALLNNSDQVVFQNVLSDGRTGLFAWTPTDGLFPLLFTGDTSILGSNYPLSSFSYTLSSNADGGVQALNDNGQFVLRVASTANGGNNAIIVLQVPAPGAAGAIGFAAIGLLATRRRR
jgi:hypothetical protein